MDEPTSQSPDLPWDLVRWNKLKKLSNELFSEAGRLAYGRATCIAASALIAIGTSKGRVLVFDYNQDIKAIFELESKASSCGPVTAVALSADHSTVAAGFSDGTVLTWEISKPMRPLLHLPPASPPTVYKSEAAGHVEGAAIVHLGFLGTRHTALVTADKKGMAFSHLASRGFGAISRSIHTTRILGRYPQQDDSRETTKKPSSVLACSPMPLGNVESISDSLGLVAILTPYLLVIVSTTPVAHTQHKASRPKELAPHGALSAAVAWYPPMKLAGASDKRQRRNAKLAYCWLNIVTFLEVIEIESPNDSVSEAPSAPDFQFRKKWEATESIVAMQWLSDSVLALVTITQELLILDYNQLQVTNSSDLLLRQIYHVDLFSDQLGELVDPLDEQNVAMHGVVADAFYMSLRAYKGRLFLLGYNDVSIGALSNWADCLLALMERGDFVAAIGLATVYYTGDCETASLGLPEDASSRQTLVGERLREMILASLKYAFGRNQNARSSQVDEAQLEQLVSACFRASLALADMQFIFEDVYLYYLEAHAQAIFFNCLEVYVLEERIGNIPPIVLKDLVNNFETRGRSKRLEEMVCKLNPENMDIDQITSLCRRLSLHDALFYIWSQGIGDYTTPLKISLEEPKDRTNSQQIISMSSRVFSYLSYTLTGRIFPTGIPMLAHKASSAKRSVYQFLFSSNDAQKPIPGTRFLEAKRLLDLDPPSFFEVLDEAFEDTYLNNPSDNPNIAHSHELNVLSHDNQSFGFSPSRQLIVTILLRIFDDSHYGFMETLYLDMFIARNTAKFPQFLLLPGKISDKILKDLSHRPPANLAEDCELSVEYLLSVYQPPDLLLLIPRFLEAKFFRVAKSIYRAEKQYPQLLQTCFDDTEHPTNTFDCIRDFLRPNSGLDHSQTQDIKRIIIRNAHQLQYADLGVSAMTLSQYAPDLHRPMIRSLEWQSQAQFEYLSAVMVTDEQHDNDTSRHDNDTSRLDSHSVENYVELLCEFDPSRVTEYITKLLRSHIRVEQVVPTLEDQGIVDAVVSLMAQKGQLREALDQLTTHLRTLNTVLLGTINMARFSVDIGCIRGGVDELLTSLEKYASIGISFCQKQTQAQSAIRQTPFATNYSNDTSHAEPDESLAQHELLWLYFIDAVVEVTRASSDACSANVELVAKTPPKKKLISSDFGLLGSKELIQLRSRLLAVAHNTFASLLATTSNSGAHGDMGANVVFIRVFRAFLSRVAIASPSLTHLRGILNSIFSAYAYEEETLTLAHRLLGQNLYVSIEDVSKRRQKGWRPLGQVCGGCGIRIWGPGVGCRAWDAWLKRTIGEGQELLRVSCYGDDSSKQQYTPLTSAAKERGNSTSLHDQEFDNISEHSGNSLDDRITSASSKGAVIAFSCRHIFHKECLDTIRVRASSDGNRQGPAPLASTEYDDSCPLEF